MRVAAEMIRLGHLSLGLQSMRHILDQRVVLDGHHVQYVQRFVEISVSPLAQKARKQVWGQIFKRNRGSKSIVRSINEAFAELATSISCPVR